MSFKKFFQKHIATPPVKKWVFNKAGFNKYGLYHDDVLYETPVVEEAVRRLPPEVYDARMYRLIRAHQLSLSHSILPEKERPTFEEDQKNRYLEKLMEEVEKEIKERKIWGKTH